MLRGLFTLLLSLSVSIIKAQVVGGEHVFEFLRISNSPHMTALGGASVVNPTPDLMMSRANPALLRPEFHSQLGLTYNAYYAGAKMSQFLYAFHFDKINTDWSFGIQSINYGKFNRTDLLGNSQGDFQASDLLIHTTFARQYLQRWRYGATIKYAVSQLIDKRSSALLVDLGLVYADTANGWYLGSVFKNAGVHLKHFDPSKPSPLPYDLQIGMVKRFKKAPFSLSALAYHLYKWDIRYDNPLDRVSNNLFAEENTNDNSSYFADKLFRHFVFALDMRIGKRIELSAGYNHLRRSELALQEQKGMSGFSLGVGLYLNKYNIHFARSYYHITGPVNEIGLTLNTGQLFGIGVGKGDTKINWSEKYGNLYQ